MIRKLGTLFISLLLLNFVWAQEATPAFWNDIQRFKSQDSINVPAKNAILFVGSSSFTKWTDVQAYFPGYKIINRGFGGSSLPDLIRYADDIIFPYQPKQIVIYCGENDLASSDTVTAALVFQRFETLYKTIRARMPKVPIAFISLKPSPSRERLWPKMIEVNSMIKKYLNKKKYAAFIDVYHSMFNKDGSVKKDIFLDDNLHMNKKGYAIWQPIIKWYLKK